MLREIDISVRGTDYLSRLPTCYTWRFNERAPYRAMVSSVEKASGYHIARENEAVNALGDSLIGRNALAIVLGVKPVIQFESPGRPAYYLMRDIWRAAKPYLRRCMICRVRLTESNWNRRSGENLCRADKCLFRLLSPLRKEQEEWKRLRNCRLQLKAMRKYLNGIPEAFQSLPAGFGPAKTSPK